MGHTETSFRALGRQLCWQWVDVGPKPWAWAEQAKLNGGAKDACAAHLSLEVGSLGPALNLQSPQMEKWAGQARCLG